MAKIQKRGERSEAPEPSEVSVVESIDPKVKAIMESAMPDAQKQEYLREIGAIKGESDEGKIPFNVYAKLRKVSKDTHVAMMRYPKAKVIRLASLDEWDEIFKNF